MHVDLRLFKKELFHGKISFFDKNVYEKRKSSHCRISLIFKMCLNQVSKLRLESAKCIFCVY